MYGAHLSAEAMRRQKLVCGHLRMARPAAPHGSRAGTRVHCLAETERSGVEVSPGPNVPVGL
jgi:hypothetical protein